MKIQLAHEQNVEVLVAEGEITVHDVKILQAGVKKILSTGKNRIVLELKGAPSLPAEALREISKLDLFARELSGRVLVAGVTPTLKQVIEQFAKPPILHCFESRAEAIKFFSMPEDKPPVAATPAATTAAAAPSAVAPTSAAGANKEAILAMEKGDVGQLRKRIAELEHENKILQSGLNQWFFEGEKLPSEAAYQEKIKSLEAQIETYLLESQKAQGAPAAKK